MQLIDTTYDHTTTPSSHDNICPSIILQLKQSPWNVNKHRTHLLACNAKENGFYQQYHAWLLKFWLPAKTIPTSTIQVYSLLQFRSHFFMDHISWQHSGIIFRVKMSVKNAKQLDAWIRRTSVTSDWLTETVKKGRCGRVGWKAVNHHSIVCLMTGLEPLPKRVLHIVQPSASSFNFQYPLLSLRSSTAAYIFFLVFPSLLFFPRSFLQLHVL